MPTYYIQLFPKKYTCGNNQLIGIYFTPTYSCEIFVIWRKIDSWCQRQSWSECNGDFIKLWTVAKKLTAVLAAASILYCCYVMLLLCYTAFELKLCVHFSNFFLLQYSETELEDKKHTILVWKLLKHMLLQFLFLMLLTSLQLFWNWTNIIADVAHPTVNWNGQTCMRQFANNFNYGMNLQMHKMIDLICRSLLL